MATTKEFVDAMETLVRVHSIYIGSVNGELLVDMPIGRVFEMERAYEGRDEWVDTARDFEFIAKCYRSKFDMTKAKAGDCSGQIVGVLRALHVIKPTADYRARDFQNLTTQVSFKNLIPGDLVFDKEVPPSGKSIAGHIGVYVGDGMVIDCRGRDAGVVKRGISNYNWKAAGRLVGWFEDDVPPFTRNLRYIPDNMMHGKDVLQCQEQLAKKGYTEVGSVDGVFGSKTDSAVRHFQKDQKLEIDGIVGRLTWNALFE